MPDDDLLSRPPAGKVRGLRAIAIFKFLNGLLLLALAAGMVNLLDKDFADLAARFFDKLPVDSDNRHVAALLTQIGLLDARKLAMLSAATFCYSALFLVEGVGLFFAKRWAEYLTILATASFVPFEVYEVVKRFGFAKLALLSVNVAIVWFLCRVVRDNKMTEH